LTSIGIAFWTTIPTVTGTGAPAPPRPPPPGAVELDAAPREQATAAADAIATLRTTNV
jgi:hypothetical protein